MNYTKVGIDASKVKLVGAYRMNGVGEVRMVTVANRKEALKPWIEKLQMQGMVQVCYEASSVGYEIYRWVTGLGADCEVVAPSLIPKKAGHHVKTDTRDAKELLSLFEADLLTSVHVPTESEEALRDLVRSRGDMRKTLTQHKHRLNPLMQRHGRIYPGKAPWTQKHMNWIRRETLTEQAAESTKAFYLRWVEQSQGELERVEVAIREQAPKHQATYALAQRFTGFYGIDTMSGIGLACELLDVRRFQKPGELMAFVGLTGREYSSGPWVRRGSITKTGNARVRHLLIQAAWKYTRKPLWSERLRAHWKTQPVALETIAQKAKERLFKRYHHLVNRGKQKQKAVVAIARELAGFLGAAGQIEATAA